MSGPLKLYDVDMHGIKTRMKLNEADAERYNATPVAPETGSAPEAVTQPETPGPAKKRTAANKARTAAADKDGGSGGGD